MIIRNMLLYLIFLTVAVCPVLYAKEPVMGKAIGLEEAIQLIPSDMQTPGRYALIVGASDYKDDRVTDLPACTNDARGVYAAITDPAIGMFKPADVTLLLNESVTERNVVQELDNIASKAGTDDLVLIYFSGHGAVDSRQRSYWIMYDTDISSLRATALPETDITDLLADIRTTRLVTLIDTCFSAATAEMNSAKAVLDLKKLYPKFTGKGRVAITASDGDQLSVVIRDKKHPGFGYSVFSWHVIGALKGAGDTDFDGVVTVGELWDYVKDRTAETARQMRGRQQPQLKGKIGSKFMLTLNSGQLIANLNKSKHLAMQMRRRLDKINRDYIDGNMTLDRYDQGKKLFSSNKSRLTDDSVRLLDAFTFLADGKYTAQQFERAIDAIGSTSSAVFTSDPDGLWKLRSGNGERLLIEGDQYILYESTGTNQQSCTIKGSNLAVGQQNNTFFMQGNMLTIVPDRGGAKVYQRLDYDAYKDSLEKASLFYSAKIWISGIGAADKALEINPYSQDALKIKSDILSGRKQQKVDELWSLAEGFRSNENYTLAIAATDDLLKLSPDDGKAKSYRVELETLKARGEAISEDFQNAKRFQASGKLDDSIIALNKVLLLDPKHVQAKSLQLKVLSLHREQELKRQKRMIELMEIVALNNNKAHGKEAIKALEEFLQLNPGNAEALALRKKIHGYYGPVAGEVITNSIGMTLVYVPSGVFTMGSNDGESDEKPMRGVEISKGFYMGQYEVTQSQFSLIMGRNPSHFQTGKVLEKGGLFRKAKKVEIRTANHPVEQVSWKDAVEFCRRLSRTDGRAYGLPTEAQWEYACRAGASTAFSFGTRISGLRDHGWYKSNSDGKTHPVGSRKPNAFGLFDMHGNVWEWCSDWYGSDYYSKAFSIDPENKESATFRVLRGGSWDEDASSCRSANRYRYDPANRFDSDGFRVVVGN